MDKNDPKKLENGPDKNNMNDGKLSSISATTTRRRRSSPEGSLPSSPRERRVSGVIRDDGGGGGSSSTTTTKIVSSQSVPAVTQISSSLSSSHSRPPRNSPADDPPSVFQQQQQQQQQQQDPSPIASPSSVSISSKTTIRAGVGQQEQQQQQYGTRISASSSSSDQQHHQLPPPLSLDGNSTAGTTFKLQPLSSRHHHHHHNLHPNSNNRGIIINNNKNSSSGNIMTSPKLSPSTATTSRKVSDPSSSSQQQQKPSGHGVPSLNQQQQQQQTIIMPPLPMPRKSRRCPLFCCFYAEFDNVVGPKICYESPLGFMEQSTDVSLTAIHKLLSSNFDRILSSEKNNNGTTTTTSTKKEITTGAANNNTAAAAGGNNTSNATYNNNANSNSTTPTKIERTAESVSAASTSNNNNATAPTVVAAPSTSSPQQQQQQPQQPQSPPQTLKGSKSTDSVGTIPVTNTTPPPSAAAAAAAAVKSSHNNSTTTNNNNSAGGNVSSSSCDSVFDSMSDFIITGNELTGNIVNLSAFNMHLLTRPTIIHDKRYERNSLLFCVGFILRRTEDPRPFRPLLSKLALKLKRMEMESDFLSNKESSRKQIQPLLDRILVSLNCTNWETNLVVNNNVLNLKLFHPPKYPASPVPDHAVPILMRRDWQVQMYDWDLAINWVVLHIDGVANARQISKKAEVDMEMVRNCLRVLKHHGVISVVDMFFYSNRYSPTKRAASMLAGNESTLLQEAAEYVIKRPPQAHPITTPTTTTQYNNLMMPMSPPTASPTTLQERFVHPPVVAAGITSPVPGSPIMSSFPPELNDGVTAAAVSSSLLGSSLKYATFASYQSQDPHLFGSLRREEQKELKTALAELYCSLNRNMSFGDLWVALATGERSRSQSFDRSVDKNKSSHVAAAAPLGTSDNNTRETSNINTRFQYQQNQSTSGSNTHRGSSYNNTTTRGDSTVSGSEGTREQADGTEMSLKDHYLDRLLGKSACAAIDWGGVFDSIDHRRFISFGLVNGLLDRVHNFPFLLDIPSTSSSTNQRKEQCSSFGRSPSVDERILMARSAANMMDGLHCDDHIVSVFEKPINELVDMVEEESGKKVLSTYSVAVLSR